jgi:hypothetical protein
MKLVQINYETPNKPKRNLLLLYLGQLDNILIGIETTAIKNADMVEIKKSKSNFDEMTLSDRINWVIKKFPTAYKKGYRKIYLSNIKSITDYSF